jgi:hypothetical protein
LDDLLMTQQNIWSFFRVAHSVTRSTGDEISILFPRLSTNQGSM